jgi:hypothetical protein
MIFWKPIVYTWWQEISLVSVGVDKVICHESLYLHDLFLIDIHYHTKIAIWSR